MRLARGHVAAVAVISMLTLAPSTSPASAVAASFSFRMSGLEGAGFQNTVAWDPFTPGAVLAGGDVSGISRSVDGGRTWTPANLGVPSSMFHVATIAYSTATPGLAYAGAGNVGRAGGLLMSEDSGRSWRVLSTTPQFSGVNNINVPGLPPVHPRSTGNLIVHDELTGAIYAGTFAQGVLRSTDNGASWTTLGLAGSHIRSLIGDPANPAVLYAATYEGGVFSTSDAPTDGTFSQVAGSPGSAEELALVGTSLYAAAGVLGLFSYSPLTGTWDRLDSATLPTTNKTWTAITGYPACGQTMIYAGSDEPGSNVVVRSADGGHSWSGLGAGAVHTEVGGAGGRAWWLAARPDFMLGGTAYLTSQLAIAPAAADVCSRNDVVMAGRSGVWGTSDAGANWYPYVRRLGTTVGYGVAADATRPGRALAVTADWVGVASADGLETVAVQRPGPAARGMAVAFGPAGIAYIGSGDQKTSNTGGEVYSNTDVTSGGKWLSERLGGPAGGRRPVALSARSVNGSTVLLAAVQGSGLWRKSNGVWSHVSGSAAASGSQALRASFAWSAASNVAFLYDNKSGLWRSSDAGVTWTKIWSKAAGSYLAGYVAADPSTAGRIYVAAGQSGLFRLDNATRGSVTAGTLAVVPVQSSPNVGPLVVGSDGVVLVSVSAGADGTGAALLRSSDAGGSWTDVSDDTYRATGAHAAGMALDNNGTLYLALSGSGVVTGVPAG